MVTETRKLIYTIPQVAEKLQVSRNLCYRLARQKLIPGVIELGSKRLVVSAAAIDHLLEGTNTRE